MLVWLFLYKTGNGCWSALLTCKHALLLFSNGETNKKDIIFSPSCPVVICVAASLHRVFHLHAHLTDGVCSKLLESVAVCPRGVLCNCCIDSFVAACFLVHATLHFPWFHAPGVHRSAFDSYTVGAVTGSLNAWGLYLLIVLLWLQWMVLSCYCVVDLDAGHMLSSDT